MQHLRSLFDVTSDEALQILQTAADIKRNDTLGERPAILQGYTLIQLFEKPSLRTRCSFEAAITQLGGGGLFMTCAEAGLNGRESIEDVARVVAGYADFIVLRTFSQKLIEDFAAISSVPVINGLSDERHPCQALTDLFTLQEVFGALDDLHLVFVGDGNNVSASLAILTAMLGVKFTLATPPDFQLDDSIIAEVQQRYPDAQFTATNDPVAAVKEASVVYTDVWASMGQESEQNARIKAFQGFQVNVDLMNAAPKDCKFMHDLPAKRGLEVTDEVMDGPNSIVFQQAENRMHLAKGLFVALARGNA